VRKYALKYDTDAGKKEIQLQLEKMKKSVLPLVQIDDVQKHRPLEACQRPDQCRPLEAYQRSRRALLGRPRPVAVSSADAESSAISVESAAITWGLGGGAPGAMICVISFSLEVPGGFSVTGG
jgi:hypothetical protein